MSTHKTLIISGCILAGLVLLIGVFAGIRHWAANTITQKLSNKLAPLQFTLSTELAPFWSHPLCFRNISLSQSDNNITLNNVCLKNSTSVFSLPDNIPLNIQSVQAHLDKSLLDSLSHEHQTSSTSTSSSGHNRIISASIENLNLQLSDNDQNASPHSQNLALNYENGQLNVSGLWDILSHHIDKSPVAFDNIPSFEVNASADIHQKSASAEFTAIPEIKLLFYHHDTAIETRIEKIQINIDKSGLTLNLINTALQAPDFKLMSSASIEQIKAAFSTHVPSRNTLTSLEITSPAIAINLPELLKHNQFKENPLFSGLITFWQQDAGSILGEAPNNSVRREDVKKNKPVVRKNPISPKTLNKVKSFFDEFQQKVSAMPAIDIHSGSIEIINQEKHYTFNAISFNTAELFKDSQKFQLKFNVRDASAVFLVGYEKSSPYPVVAFDIQKLSTADFLHIINMPVPEQNAGTVSLNLTASMSDEDFRLAGNIQFNEFAFYHPKISPNTVHNVNASAIFEAEYIFAQDSLALTPLTLKSGPITLDGNIKIANLRSAPLIEFSLGANDIICSDIPKAIPDGFLPTITELRFTGTTISPKIWGKIPWKSPLTSSLKESGFEGKCYPVSVLPHHPEELNDPAYTFTTDYTYFTQSITVGPGTKDYTPLEDIPPYVKAAMFLTEDKRFFDHGPLRIAFIERALRLNLNQRKYVYGGSTIAQQLTKNLFLNRNKNLARKLEEALIAWRLEAVVPRLRIFELYLNVIEFGPDIYGITKASKFYFNKQPKDLTPLEGAFLASLKVSPSKGGRFYKTGFAQNGMWWHKRMRYILKVLAENGYISPAEAISAYNWTPEFYYPTTPGDFRQKWLNDYGEYLKEKAKQKKIEEKQNAKGD